MKQVNTKEIIGISYPTLPEHAEKIFSKKRVLYPKFTPHGTPPLFLKKDSKFLFYVSHNKKEIIGEGKIAEIKKMKFDEFINKQKDSFLDEGGLKKYLGKRLGKDIIIFDIRKIKRYDFPIKLNFCVNMGGRYFTKKEYKILRGHK